MFDMVQDATNYSLMSKCAHMLSPICEGMSAEGKNLSGFLWVKKINKYYILSSFPLEEKHHFVFLLGLHENI